MSDTDNPGTLPDQMTPTPEQLTRYRMEQLLRRRGQHPDRIGVKQPKKPKRKTAAASPSKGFVPKTFSAGFAGALTKSRPTSGEETP